MYYTSSCGRHAQSRGDAPAACSISATTCYCPIDSGAPQSQVYSASLSALFRLNSASSTYIHYRSSPSALSTSHHLSTARTL